MPKVPRKSPSWRSPPGPFSFAQPQGFPPPATRPPFQLPLQSRSRGCRVEEPVQIQGQSNNGIFDVFGEIYDCIGLGKLIGATRKDRQWNDILKALVLARIATPESKRKTARVLSRDYQVNHPLQKYYRTMDKVIKFEREAQTIVMEETRRIHGAN